MPIVNRKINDLIGENYVYASVLYYMGIKFYDYSEETLKQVCDEKKLDIDFVIGSLESVSKGNDQRNIKLKAFPIDLIIEYLKHTHYIFIKQKLPFIARLLKTINKECLCDSSLIEDLQLVFPLFIEDFIHHIYEEEDTLFYYISNLNKAHQGKYNYAELYFQMEKFSVQKYAMEHELHGDEMQGIRKITKGYQIKDTYDLRLKVLLSELQSFEKELTTHAHVEDEILFPKALHLEKEVKKMFAAKIIFN